jgi:ABC-type glycerol-3-phosphate transport system permease component
MPLIVNQESDMGLSSGKSTDIPRAGNISGADGIRALACLAVIFHHAFQRLDYYTQPGWMQEIQSFFLRGSSGVSIFFVLSGFLLSYPFWKSYLDGASFPKIKKYIMRRAARIMPAYYAAFFVSIFLAVLYVDPFDNFWRRLFTGLTFTGGFHYTTLFPVDWMNSPLWSISFEVFSYVLMPIFMAGLFFLAGKTRSFRKAFVFWIGVLALVLAVNGVIHMFLTPDSLRRGWEFGVTGGSKWWMPNYNPAGFFAHFALGVIASGVTIRLSRPSERMERFRSRGYFDIASVILILSIVFFVWDVRNLREFSASFQHQPYFFPFLTVLVASLLVTLAHSNRAGQLLDNRFCRFTAKVSFGLYIWHFVIINIFSFYGLRRYQYMGVKDFPLWLCATAVILIASYIAATVSWHIIEKPALDRAHQDEIARDMNIKVRRRFRLRPWLSTAFLSLIALVFLFPLVWLFDASLRPPVEMLQMPPVIFQKPIWLAVQTYTRASYTESFLYWNSGLALINSIVVTSGTIILTGVVSSLCAYALVFINFRHKRFFFLIAICTMMLPTSTLIVGFYHVVSSLHLVNSWLGLILPASVSGFSVFLLRQYFIKIPFEVVESAKLDGASHLRIWWHIILPIARPALAAFAIIQFRIIWNDLLIPIIVMRDEKLFTLPVKMIFISNTGAIAATGFVTIFIPLVLFVKFHRQFIDNLTAGVRN